MALKSDILKALSTLSVLKIDGNLKDVRIENVITDLMTNLCPLSGFENVYKLYKPATYSDSLISWKYILFSLECLESLKGCLSNENNDVDKLMSVAHQKCVRVLLDKVIGLGLIPNLLPGVDPLNKTVFSSTLDALNDIQKYECISVVTLVCIDLCHDDTFHSILLPHFLTPIMCALCQLAMAPLKESADMYPQLQLERLTVREHLDLLVNKLYQPMVIKELMIIEGNKNSPRWLKRGVGTLLTRQLHRPQGLQAVVEAVRDAANCASPSSSAHMEAVARVVAASPDLINMCRQITLMLDSSDAEFVRFAVLCAKTLQCKDPEVFNNHLLKPITRSLTQSSSSEQDLTICLNRLHKCFAVPASDLWCLSPHLLQNYVHSLFRLNCKVYRSVSHLRKSVEDLIWVFLSNCDDEVLSKVFHWLLFNKQVPDIINDSEIEFVFADDGGVKTVLNRAPEYSLEEFGDCLMILLERKDTNGVMGNKLFATLIEFATEEKEAKTLDMLEIHLVTIKLLAILSENEAVQKCIGKHPEPVVRFLKVMIDHFISRRTEGVEIIKIVLLVLNIVLHDFVFSENPSWQVFSSLKTPLLSLKNKTHNPELQLLAEEAYKVIMTHGAVKPAQKNSQFAENNPRVSKEVSTFDESLREACDALLPVRGHAMIQLGKLLAARDKEAKAKKEQILCIFQENLKHEDSFLYLSAIEGLSIAAAVFPDTVIVLLAEQFSRQSLTPDCRLKVGEALVRVIKLLGDLVPVYKAELTNAFLAGTRDNDPLVRASSLSALGELCRALTFSVGPILSEVLMCAQCIFSSDPSVEVCRAAVMLVALLLKGLQKKAFTVLKDVLAELYRSLKRIYSSDKDDVTRLHAQLALEELNSGTRMFLFPKPELTKQILVVDHPA